MYETHALKETVAGTFPGLAQPRSNITPMYSSRDTYSKKKFKKIGAFFIWEHNTDDSVISVYYSHIVIYLVCSTMRRHIVYYAYVVVCRDRKYVSCVDGRRDEVVFRACGLVRAVMWVS